MDDRQFTLLENLKRADTLTAPEFARAVRRVAWMAEFSAAELNEFLQAVTQATPLTEPADRLLAGWLNGAVQARVGQDAAANLSPAVARLYGRLEAGSPSRGPLLAWLASGSTSEQLTTLGKLLTSAPPDLESAIVQGLAPLFQRRQPEVAKLFPDLLDALAHPTLAAPVLDLANFLVREKLVAAHPAVQHSGQLIRLLGDLVQSLSLLEEQPLTAGDSAQQLAQRVARAVALAVSLCDALGLIGNAAAIPKLHQALTLGHRRVKTEAAAALARLGDERGVDELIQLVAEPVARLRVLAYAQELGISNKMEPKFASPEARAEAELCVWLAEPTQFGLPPTRCELFDQRRQYWPGFGQPVNCYLFRFQYVVTVDDGERSFSNIGIAGPLAHAFLADLGDLSPEDIYAAFAGWQATHEDIREYEVARLSQSEQLEVKRLKRRLHDGGYTQIQPQIMGYLFGDKALVAQCEREGAAGVAVVDFSSIAFFPARGGRRSLGPAEAYCIYKGRKLLRAFNRPASPTTDNTAE